MQRVPPEGDVGMMTEEEIDKLKSKVGIIRETNSALVDEIERMGGGVDLTLARFEHLVQALEDLGVITTEQRWNEQLAWETGLKSQLIAIRDRLIEMHAASPDPRRPIKAPPKKQLWLPGR